MRARNLKPGFFKNDVLADCEPLARILYQGLWCLADREGRLKCRPKQIKAEILPYDNCNTIKLLEQLTSQGFIIVYKYDNEIFLEIPTFTQHQTPHIKEAESTIPAPDKSDTCTVVAPPFPESLFLNPFPESFIPHRKGAKVLNQDLFEKFWKEYPRKKAKGDAEKAWAKINPSEHLTENILSAVQRAKTSTDWLKDSGQFIPYPATWLNRKGWEDEYNNNDNNGNQSKNPIVSKSSEGILAWALQEDGHHDQ